MSNENPIQAIDDLPGDSEEMAPARGIALGVLIGALIWWVAILAVARGRFVL